MAIVTEERVGRRAPLRLTAGCVLLDDRRRVLLLQRADNGGWALPGGSAEPGESAAAAVAREVQEEGAAMGAPRAPG